MSTNPTPSWSALKRKDLRRSRRYAVDGETMRVSWLGLNGALNVVHHARVVNISEEGIAVELPEPAQLVSRIKLEAEKHRLLGEGTVRHCRRVSSKYVVGVEFVDGLRWRAPEEPVVEPVALSDPG
jgi:PilZ domain